MDMAPSRAGFAQTDTHSVMAKRGPSTAMDEIGRTADSRRAARFCGRDSKAETQPRKIFRDYATGTEERDARSPVPVVFRWVPY